MARPLRIEFPGALYHVISRGTQGNRIFADRRDRQRFIKYLKENLPRYEVVVYAYSLMHNHYHLLLETKNANLAEFMHTLNSSFVIYYNTRHDRHGPLFQGRYRALVVDREPYLLELSRYIHLNPVRAGVAEKPEEYEWSSYGVYLGIDSKDWIATGWLEERFGKSWRRKYREFVMDGETKSPFDKLQAGIILGSESFVEWAKTKIRRGQAKREIPSLKALVSVTMDEVVKKTCDFFGVSEEELLRRRKNFLPRKMALYLVRKRTPEKIDEIARRFGITYPAVTKSVRRMEAEIEENQEAKKIASLIDESL